MFAREESQKAVHLSSKYFHFQAILTAPWHGSSKKGIFFPDEKAEEVGHLPVSAHSDNQQGSNLKSKKYHKMTENSYATQTIFKLSQEFSFCPENLSESCM